MNIPGPRIKKIKPSDIDRLRRRIAQTKATSNFLLQLAELQNQINEMPQIHGADIYVQDTEPDTLNDYVWIDTNGVNFIS
ncbi:MAG: hypothetical protein LHW64_11665 [Candidatus Cloacimonetes bacterium]|nr:hypothetical protein [Candidatus Cloacimonadota bacterium]MDY0230741.1 hypothetical protein [Candidatus Cloacimonadaceae bacterium]